jgi:hypothetical protein
MTCSNLKDMISCCWNYLEEVDIKIFRKDVAELLAYVEKVLTIPYDQRGEPAFK